MKIYIFILLFLVSILHLQAQAINPVFIPSSINPEKIVLQNIDAQHIQLAGNWNNWAGTSLEGKIDKSIGNMYRNNAGNWIYDLQYFINGKYEFKIIIDGNWEKEIRSFEINNSPILNFYDSINFNAPNANEVIIAGTWNNWAGTEKAYLDEALGKMFKDDTGVWHYVLTPLKIKSGIHKYKFIIDGKFEKDVPKILILK